MVMIIQGFQKMRKNINLKGLLFNEFYIFGIKIVDDPEVGENVGGVA